MRKQNLFKKAAAVSLAAAMAAGSVTTAFAGQWKNDANGYWWQNDDGSYPKNEWKWLDGNGDGISESYYFDGNGYLLTNTTTPDGYTVNGDGQWVENGTVKTQGSAKSSASKGTSGTSAKTNVNQSKLVSYMKNVDDLSKTSRVKPVGEGVTYPTTDMIKAGDQLYWKNTSGGTDYVLFYAMTDADRRSANIEYKLYPNAQTYPTFESWTTPSGVTVDYLWRVLDENGKIKTATAAELGVDYEGGKVRDVAYDSNYPLKRVVDLYALNIEALGQDWYIPEKSHHGLQGHNGNIMSPSTAYIISKLSGQTNTCHEDSWYKDQERQDLNEVCEVLRNWLNSFDFEHATEPERLAKIQELLHGSEYDQTVADNKSLHTYNSYHQVLLNKKGICYDYALTGQLLATLLGLKSAIVGDAAHACYVIQADGIPHMCENGYINQKEDWRETSKLGTKQSYNYRFGETIPYV